MEVELAPLQPKARLAFKLRVALAGSSGVWLGLGVDLTILVLMMKIFVLFEINFDHF